MDIETLRFVLGLVGWLFSLCFLLYPVIILGLLKTTAVVAARILTSLPTKKENLKKKLTKRLPSLQGFGRRGAMGLGFLLAAICCFSIPYSQNLQQFVALNSAIK
eukprot:2521204-Rhodomonas_salina.1